MLSMNKPSSSSKDASALAFRDRLRGDATIPPLAQSPVDSFPEAFKQFRTLFRDGLATSTRKEVHTFSSENTDDASQLRESYAEAGAKLHASSMEQIMHAHNDVEADIKKLQSEIEEVLSFCDKIYSNISFPLSATICHTQSRPRATLATHLANLSENIKATKDRIAQLGVEWDALVKEEQNTLDYINQVKKSTKKTVVSDDAHFSKTMASFKMEAENIVNEKCKMLEKIEEEFMRGVQTETMKWMQSFT